MHGVGYTTGVIPTAPRVQALEQELAPLRARLVAHPLYAAVDSLPRLRRFMGQHVFAVWDFMVLLKRLQRDLTCVDVVWRPPADPLLARFVNEVVLVEESDQLPDGPLSHLELYRAAMLEVRAEAPAFQRLLEALRAGQVARAALHDCGAPAHVVVFVESTLALAEGGSTAAVLGSFLYGREDVIPDMFRRLLGQWQGTGAAPAFALYLERHVAVDGDSHGPLARLALERVLSAGGPETARAVHDAAADAIVARIALWDGVCTALAARG